MNSEAFRWLGLVEHAILDPYDYTHVKKSINVPECPPPVSENVLALQPIFCFKQTLPPPEERIGLITLRYPLPGGTVRETYYTRLDQALILWGGVTAIIFLTAQFSYWDWHTQAIADSTLTVSATWLTGKLAWPWATARKARWVVGFWSGLMLSAIVLSDYGIVTSNSLILQHLCTGWLGVCALGYFVTAIGMKSRALTLVAMVHLCAVLVVREFIPWQFLLTGSILTLSLCLLGTLQWDHR